MSKSKGKFPAPHGFVSPGFEGVMDAFKSGFSQGVDKGASLAISYKGSLVVRAWGGLADEQARRPWTEDGYGFFFSGCKFLAAVVIAHLVEKGLLNYEEKISKYWPEFAQNGKESITLSMLLSHKAGISVADEEGFELQWMRNNPSLLRKVLEKQRPLWEPGKEHGYSMIIIGPYINEIVRRVDRKERTLSQYFHDEIAVPFNLDLHIGVPKPSFHRMPRLNWPRYSKEELAKRMSDFPGDITLYRKSMSDPRDWNSPLKLNDPDFASLPNPGSHAMGSAASVATLAGIISNGGQCEGRTLMTQTSIERLQTPLAHGTDFINCSEWTYGLGTMLIPARLGDKTWFIFGHSGLGGQAIWLDSVHGFGMAYCTNYMQPFSTFNDNRWKHILMAVYASILGVKEANKIKLFESYQAFSDDLKANPVKCKL